MSAFAVRAGLLLAMPLLALFWVTSPVEARTAPQAELFANGTNPGLRPQADKAYMIRLQGHGQRPVSLYAEEFGRGRPILLVHGLGASSYTWRHLVGPLSRRHRVITLDLKGFGRSEKPFDKAYSLLHHASLVSAFIRKRRLHDLTLIGHSFGGAVALVVALDLNRSSRARIRNLVLMNAPAYPQPNTDFVSFMHAPVLPYVVLGLVPPVLATWLSLDDQQQKILSGGDVRAYAAPFYDPAARHALITTARQIVPANADQLIAMYPSIRQRTLVIWCQDDSTVPLGTGRRLTQALPRARLKVIDGCTHAPQDERPRATIQHISRFLR